MISPDGIVGAVVSLALLAAVLVVTMAGVTVAGRRIPPATVAVPAAALVGLFGLADWTSIRDELAFIGPTIGFLAAMLVVADICARRGVFAWVGGIIARGSRGSPNRLLQIVFVVAAATTAVLSLDATIVLLTPVAVLTARRIGARIAPTAHATAHLANSASTLLPVSNLTNLLAFGATGLTFLGFAQVMAAPFVVAIVVEYLLFRWFFADQLSAPPSGETPRPPDDESRSEPSAPWFELGVLSALLIGFVVAEPLHIPLAVVATIGAVVLALPYLFRTPREAAVRMVRATDPLFLAFVAALGAIILPVREGPLGSAIAGLIPDGQGLPALLAVAVLAALLANVVNNLPATLLLVPLTVHQPALVLAVLLGVNIGPNLGYFGSLATLLWREVLHRDSASAPPRTYLRLGLVTVPPTLLASVVALWLALRLT
ncbi:SLC13 family permease [Gordonia soli]|uniref:Arsenite resistance pump n=1 Tax=Gordonia soli NBRC 108243 TaxID=1223545 RepID=M0QRY8_9ACTN|nr:SLC13 family permease [Gordonia soli]GAC70522.1 arsenite resistance pump [Gordonia soli NBRC 108243]